jgi:hypothetical protein
VQDIQLDKIPIEFISMVIKLLLQIQSYPQLDIEGSTSLL